METGDVEKKREEQAEHALRYKPTFCPNYCVTVGLSSNLSPPLHTHPPSCHILYRPIWLKGGMNWREKERCDGLGDSMLAAGCLASVLSCLIAQGDSMTR